MILSTTLPKSSPAFAAHVVHIEGLDLAGKSTATQALLDRHPGSELRRNALTEGNRPFLLADEPEGGWNVGRDPRSALCRCPPTGHRHLRAAVD